MVGVPEGGGDAGCGAAGKEADGEVAVTMTWGVSGTELVFGAERNHMTSVDLMRKHPREHGGRPASSPSRYCSWFRRSSPFRWSSCSSTWCPPVAWCSAASTPPSSGLLAILIINEKLNKRTDAALGFHPRRAGTNYLLGLLAGVVVIVVVVGTAAALGAVRIAVNPEVRWWIILVLMIAFAIQGMAEEVFFRGYIQSSVAASKGMWFAVIVQAVLFAAIHALNPGMQLLPALNLVVFGFLFGLLYWYADSMWLVGAMHFAWNFLLGPVLGIEVSGMVLPSTVFEASVSGDELLTGGPFGVEGSILTTIIGVLGCVILHLLIRRKQVA